MFLNTVFDHESSTLHLNLLLDFAVSKSICEARTAYFGMELK